MSKTSEPTGTQNRMSDFKLRSAIADALSRALVPEENVSLKLAFDNLRNYAICAGLFATSGWLGAKIAEPLWMHRLTYLITALAAILLLGNGLQSITIGGRFFDQLEAFIEEVETHKGRTLARLLYALTVLAAVVLGLIFSTCVLLLAFWAIQVQSPAKNVL